MKISLKNIRRFEKIEIEVEKGARVVVVGTNNSGKSTLLESVFKTLISLPGYNPNFHSGSVPEERKFLSSFYRQQGAEIKRPEIELSFTANELVIDPTPVARENIEFKTTFIGSLLPSRMRPDRTDEGFLIPISCTFGDGTYTYNMFQTTGAIHQEPNLTAANAWDVHTIALNENGWRPVSNDWQNTTQANHQISAIYQFNTPWSRALRALVDKTFFLKAGRNPDYSPKNSHLQLSLHNQDRLTELLQRLSFDGPSFKAMSAAVSSLFSDIKDISIKEISGNVAPYCNFIDGRSTPIADMGYGLRNIIQILTIISLAPLGAILFIDEPEQGLNQAKQVEFAKVLETLREDVTIIMATQSEPFCKGLELSQTYLAETAIDETSLSKIDIKNSHDHRKRLAKVMGISALYLVEGGKIIFVEGKSDQLILSDWLKRNLPEIPDREYEIHDLGGSGKIGCEFAKPLFLGFKDRIFFLLDSDRTASTNPGPNIRKLVNWLDEKNIENKYVLKKREIENYIGAEALAETSAVNVNTTSIQPPPGASDYFDFKAAIKDQKGFFDEVKMTVGAYNCLAEERKKKLFLDENLEVVTKLQSFLSTPS